jgi:hypothetical protein
MTLNLSEMANRWPSSIVARENVREFTGGVLNPKTLANLDSQGVGPKGRFTIGRKVVYNVCDLLTFLESRAKVAAGSREV